MLVMLLHNVLKLVVVAMRQNKPSRQSNRVHSSSKQVPTNMHRVVRMATPSKCRMVPSRCNRVPTRLRKALSRCKRR